MGWKERLKPAYFGPEEDICTHDGLILDNLVHLHPPSLSNIYCLIVIPISHRYIFHNCLYAKTRKKSLECYSFCFLRIKNHSPPSALKRLRNMLAKFLGPWILMWVVGRSLNFFKLNASTSIQQSNPILKD
ncbi:hypothetical protein RJT34_22708 [Clitoria ternatea]|uniref:Uncharacterized protein n=1 Tax=Clitoria ternatea TaxID=43366 RepID=A0AAN9FRH1_CLITE